MRRLSFVRSSWRCCVSPAETAARQRPGRGRVAGGSPRWLVGYRRQETIHWDMLPLGHASGSPASAPSLGLTALDSREAWTMTTALWLGTSCGARYGVLTPPDTVPGQGPGSSGEKGRASACAGTQPWHMAAVRDPRLPSLDNRAATTPQLQLQHQRPIHIDSFVVLRHSRLSNKDASTPQSRALFLSFPGCAARRRAARTPSPYRPRTR